MRDEYSSLSGVRVIHKRKRRSVIGVMQELISQKGRLFVVLDSDDYFRPGSIGFVE